MGHDCATLVGVEQSRVEHGGMHQIGLVGVQKGKNYCLGQLVVKGREEGAMVVVP